ncbi:PTS mannnose transporter subunit IIA [Staphylococcus equorum]|uniref:dihydroxyacetone kinase phosphoryl donor subunit DhaM n=1 Tax=Staphylococcus TaxID=1279 RepID=UPI0007E9E319|nr:MULTISPECIES: dihydroxyacetone kinase phosphoryl donor subunit DhaM [Staphylococcus]ANK38079.1 phosphotransferase mannnose-specific family component IIA [Staphylococcus sp. AntiMn-1]MCE5006615.1 PTS-dependent dihydroxyacetone kinase phosphotransferase subunit DhaM [Staphylococcus equorum]MCE5047839.1 PTS-dependent dihydroxyacetone kinase phosphotransferase subunit DhaM [Staphylococcus equorum]MCZ4236027.1 dihydroxyacetone kinase phosphoryl donor subunit DhaM [Staphylococcus equorum]MEB77216
MTKIVIVSHSEDIANGTKALLEQMAGDVSILIQGGVEGKIGTSYDHIQEMINDLDDDALCFYDIGSAEMNLDLAIEMYEGKYQVVKVDAPIVEGSFTAAVKLSVGGSIKEIVEELKRNFG